MYRAIRGLFLTFLCFAAAFALHVVGGATDQGWLLSASKSTVLLVPSAKFEVTLEAPASKLKVVEAPLTPIVTASALPTKLSQAPAPKPATSLTPPSPVAVFTMVASG